MIQLRYNYTPPTSNLSIPLSPGRRTPATISSLIKGNPTISSSPAYKDEQVCLGESKGQHTSMHQKKHNSREQVVDKVLQKPEVCNAIYRIYICINADDKAHKLWIDKEVIASMATIDSHLENSILDVWSIIMNKKQLSSIILGFICLLLDLYTAILHAQKTTFKYQEFYKVMQLKTQRTNWLN
ncbi:hypothetical protein Cgig2_024534 [Carnegiea gigantea]|uniref:Uncharacterized protein n=1 Tax=Carnegiea gigantea TaxID=171969 RepID=A0A9Q1JXR9_9CARY|nr:hypothetical protein Cgig2_024534 [Carnegiea gigantea]